MSSLSIAYQKFLEADKTLAAVKIAYEKAVSNKRAAHLAVKDTLRRGQRKIIPHENKFMVFYLDNNGNLDIKEAWFAE